MQEVRSNRGYSKTLSGANRFGTGGKPAPSGNAQGEALASPLERVVGCKLVYARKAGRNVSQKGDSVNMQHIPVTCVWETTLRCNYRCRHCGSRAGKKRGEELTFEQAKGMIEELASLGCKRVILGGGEPLLRNDIKTIAQEIKKNRMKVSMISNGFLIPAKIDMVEAMDLYSIGLSIDGLERTHNYLRDNNKSFRRVMESITLIRKRRLFLDIYIITQLNQMMFSEMEELYAIVDSLGVTGWQLQLTNDMGRAEDLRDIMLRQEQIREVLDFILSKKTGGLKIFPADDLGYYYKGEFEFKGCSGGISTIGIEANGNVKPCLSMQKDNECIGGNIKERSLTSIWNDPHFSPHTRKPRTLLGACTACVYKASCRGGCVGTAMAYNSVHAYPFCVRAV